MLAHRFPGLCALLTAFLLLGSDARADSAPPGAEEQGSTSSSLDRGLSVAEEALAQQVWRTAVHEAGPSVTDVALIHQAVEANGTTPEERLRWLRRHSARVAGTKPARRPRTLWVRELRPSLERPAHWPGGMRWDRHEWWVERALWWARVLVGGRVVWRPCPGEIQSWDMKSARQSMQLEGWEPVDCSDALNLGARRRSSS